jgi:hypothetical protein
MAVSSILISKTFDNGVICASEQNMVVEAAVSSTLAIVVHCREFTGTAVTPVVRILSCFGKQGTQLLTPC